MYSFGKSSFRPASVTGVSDKPSSRSWQILGKLARGASAGRLTQEAQASLERLPNGPAGDRWLMWSFERLRPGSGSRT
jgi:hypothetical protein